MHKLLKKTVKQAIHEIKVLNQENLESAVSQKKVRIGCLFWYVPSRIPEAN